MYKSLYTDMIVNQIKEGWEIINHPAHGLLAAEMAMQLPAKNFPKGLHTQTIAAILCHDDHQYPYEHHNYVTEVGAPRDFTLNKYSKTQKLKRVKRIIKAAYQKSIWVGMLIAHHLDFLYREDSEKGKRLEKLFLAERKFRKQALKKMGLKKKDFQKTYDWMRFCDRCSLILTRRNIPERNRTVEIITNRKGKQFNLYQNDSGNLVVQPWCFKNKKFSVVVETKIITQLKFTNDQDLKNALEEAKIKTRRFTFKPSKK